MINFTAVLDNILEAANLQGYSLDPADMTRAAKDRRQIPRADGLRVNHAPAIRQLRPRQREEHQHERVNRIMSRALDTAPSTRRLLRSILSAAKKAGRPTPTQAYS